MAQKKVDKVLKVVMGIPSEGHTLPEALDNHLIHSFRVGKWEAEMKAEGRSPRYEFYWFTCGRMLTQLAREKMAEQAVAIDADYVIMYDDDMTLPPDFAQRMLETMEEHPEIDLLGALAFMRRAPYYPVLYTVQEGWDPIRNTDTYLRQYVKRYPKDKLVECDAVGFGGVCIRGSLLKKMGKGWFMSTTYQGEDLWFCYQAKKNHQARIFMHTGIKLGHLKDPDVIDEAFFEKWVEASGHDLGPEVPSKYEDVGEGVAR